MRPLWLPNLLTVLRCFAAVGVAVCLWLVLGPITEEDLSERRFQAALETELRALFRAQHGDEIVESDETLAEMLERSGADPDDIPEWMRDFRPKVGPGGIIDMAAVPDVAGGQIVVMREPSALLELRDKLAFKLRFPDSDPVTSAPRPLAMLALALFFFAAVSDFLDGFLARRWNAQSDFGRLLDPIADKLLVGLPFLVISALLIRTGDWRGMVFVALPMLAIVARDVAVTALRFSPRGGAKVEVAVLSKWKTALEMIVLGFFLAVFALSLTPTMVTATIWLAALWAATVVSVYTGYRYFRAAF